MYTLPFRGRECHGLMISVSLTPIAKPSILYLLRSIFTSDSVHLLGCDMTISPSEVNLSVVPEGDKSSILDDSPCFFILKIPSIFPIKLSWIALLHSYPVAAFGVSGYVLIAFENLSIPAIFQ